TASTMRYDGVQGHFDNLRRQNPLAAFRTQGQAAMICPWQGPEALLALTRYALPYAPAGGLQSIWELGYRFLPGMWPTVAIAGRLWSNLRHLTSPEALVDGCLRDLLPTV